MTTCGHYEDVYVHCRESFVYALQKWELLVSLSIAAEYAVGLPDHGAVLNYCDFGDIPTDENPTDENPTNDSPTNDIPTNDSPTDGR